MVPVRGTVSWAVFARFCVVAFFPSHVALRIWESISAGSQEARKGDSIRKVFSRLEVRDRCIICLNDYRAFTFQRNVYNVVELMHTEVHSTATTCHS